VTGVSSNSADFWVVKQWYCNNIYIFSGALYAVSHIYVICLPTYKEFNMHIPTLICRMIQVKLYSNITLCCVHISLNMKHINMMVSSIVLNILISPLDHIMRHTCKSFCYNDIRVKFWMWHVQYRYIYIYIYLFIITWPCTLCLTKCVGWDCSSI